MTAVKPFIAHLDKKGMHGRWWLTKAVRDYFDEYWKFMIKKLNYPNVGGYFINLPFLHLPRLKYFMNWQSIA